MLLGTGHELRGGGGVQNGRGACEMLAMLKGGGRGNSFGVVLT